MSLTFNFNKSSQRALDTAIFGCVRDAVKFLADKHGFDCESALAEMNLVQSAPTKKPIKDKILKASIPLPFCGTLLGSCCGIRVNHGLHSQCSNSKEICDISGEPLDYCKTCNKQAKSNEGGAPNGGDIRARLSGVWSPEKGKLVSYGNIMEKLNITREKAENEAAKLGLTIPEEQFEIVKGRRGRPKSDSAASSSDDEKPKKPRGRPKKAKKVINSSTGDDLISQLVAAAADSTGSSSSSDGDDATSSSQSKLAEKEAKKKASDEAKAVKLAEKEASDEAKAAKLSEKEAKKKASDEAKIAAITAVEEAAAADELEEEVDFSDGDDSEEESIDAIIKEIKGKKYVMARDTKHLYDAESHEPLNQYYDEEADEIKNLPDGEE